MVVGLDTSCYTTSLALVSLEGGLLGEARRLLPVEAGMRGMAQSEAVFHHVRNLTGLWQELPLPAGDTEIVGVAAAVRPRPEPASYMPVFTVARSYGRFLAAALGVSCWETSHQEGHIVAGLYGLAVGGRAPDSGEEGQETDPVPVRWETLGAQLPPEFLTVHLSGGTSEILRVAVARGGRLNIEVVGGTMDLPAGQLIDRIGVLMGLPFPSGPHLERLTRAYEGEFVRLPVAVHGGYFSLSGPETMACRLLQQGEPPGAVARAVEDCIAKALEKALRYLAAETGLKHVLMVGGVSANARLRERLRHRLGHRAVGASLLFPPGKYCTDNAVGAAGIGAKNLLASWQE
ncbi:MAG: O-sialoglycoprotein endopeptidase [Clostridia bacterium]|nr:MAG: O-sialoglycoprotein endopeptidase [Clostridia bacterium]